MYKYRKFNILLVVPFLMIFSLLSNANQDKNTITVSRETPSETPTSIPIGHVIVTDDIETHKDLSGEEDIDTPDQRELCIRWNLPFPDVTDFHVYVRDKERTFPEYLGRSGSGDKQELLWRAGERFISEQNRKGPQDGNEYRFYIFAIRENTWNAGPYDNKANVKYSVEIPGLPPGIPLNTVIVTDSEEDYRDLSGGTDIDPPYHRKLAIRWNIQLTDIIDFHVYVQSENANKASYLGRTAGGDKDTLVWEPGNRLITPEFRRGPQNGYSYRFTVFALRADTPPTRFSNNAAVEYLVRLFPNETPTETPTARPTATPTSTPRPTKTPTQRPEIEEGTVIVTDSLETYEDLSGKKDVDYKEERELAIRWKLSYRNAVDYHVYLLEDHEDIPVYLGRTGSPETNYLQWKPGNRLVARDFRSGPEDGHKYRFMVFVIREGRPAGPFLSKDSVKYMLEHDHRPTATPTSKQDRNDRKTPTPKHSHEHEWNYGQQQDNGYQPGGVTFVVPTATPTVTPSPVPAENNLE